MKFYKTPDGTVLLAPQDAIANLEELIPNSSDGSGEKHVPKIVRQGLAVTVQIGAVPHPMTDAHAIAWIAIETTHDFRLCQLRSGDEPMAVFTLAEGEELLAAYAYCNLHGIWKR